MTGLPLRIPRLKSKSATHTDGPTRSSARQESWKSSIWVSRVIHWATLALPSALSFFVTRAMAGRFPPGDTNLPIVLWWVSLFALGVVVLVATERVTRRLLPLAALFKLSLVFPDEAPSRFSIALRNNSTKKLERRMEEVRANGFPTDESTYARTMLELVAGLSVHDRMTRGHCERVRAYTDMISQEMGITGEDADKLRWAALLHDVGKIFVPGEILNKPGKPTEEEWAILKSHTWKGAELAEPLADFLGEWASTIRNHHERWDGNGYPDGLAGNGIPLGARVVAVADAYDVMTSARSYKKPRPASQAREEIARCAGGQFDPDVARAFLNIGVGRLRFAAGPLSWLASAQPALQFPVAALAQPLLAVVTASVATIAAGASPVVPADLAFAEPNFAIETTIVASPSSIDAPGSTTTTTDPGTSTTTAPQTVTTTGNGPRATGNGPTTTVVTSSPAPTGPTTTTLIPLTTVTLLGRQAPVARSGAIVVNEDGESAVPLVAASPADDVTFEIVNHPDHGSLSAPGSGRSTIATNGAVAQMTTQYVAARNYFGPDTFTYRTCNAAAPSLCTTARIAITVLPINDAPIANPDFASVAEGGSVVLTPATVLANDFDIEGDALTRVIWGTPPGASSVIAGNKLLFISVLGQTAPSTVTYRACDALGCGSATTVSISVVPIPDPPIPDPPLG